MSATVDAAVETNSVELDQKGSNKFSSLKQQLKKHIQNQ